MITKRTSALSIMVFLHPDDACPFKAPALFVLFIGVEMLHSGTVSAYVDCS